jgi:prokaryotic ubiquitin-like protein Pup
MAVNMGKAQTRAGATIKTTVSEEYHGLTTIVGMAAGEQKQTRRSEAPQETAEARPASNIKEKGETLKEDLDRIIDEIDEVLEENAEEFVKNYVQRGGE